MIEAEREREFRRAVCGYPREWPPDRPAMRELPAEPEHLVHGVLGTGCYCGKTLAEFRNEPARQLCTCAPIPSVFSDRGTA